MTIKINGMKKQQGLTLIELMVALVLGLILIAVVIQVFISNKQAYRVTDAHSKLQDNSRFAIETLSSDVRAASFAGCHSMDDLNVVSIAKAVIPPTPAPLGGNLIPIPADPDNPAANSILTGHEATGANTWVPALPAALVGEVISGTDVITVQHARTCGGNLNSNMLTPRDPLDIVLPNSCALAPGSIVVISDCTDAHVLRVQSVDTAPGGTSQTVRFNDLDAGGVDADASNNNNHANYLCKNYSSLPHVGSCTVPTDEKIYNFDSELFQLHFVTYFIGEGASGDPALWRYNNNAGVSAQNPIELVEGIENMQIEYGIGPGAVTQYKKANALTVGDLENTVSAQIHLLAQTQADNLTTAAQANIRFDGNILAPVADGKLRRAFSTTVAARSRMQ